MTEQGAAKVSDLLEGHGDTIAEGQEKASELGDQIKDAAQKAKDALGS
jgi:hypothetical protein